MAKEDKKDNKKQDRGKKAAQRQAQTNRNKNRDRTSFIDYIKGVRLEMKKVVWPTSSELMQYAALVVVACTFFAVAFWAIDTGFLAALKHLLGITMSS